MSKDTTVSFYQLTKDDFNCVNPPVTFRGICHDGGKGVLGVLDFHKEQVAISLY